MLPLLLISSVCVFVDKADNVSEGDVVQLAESLRGEIAGVTRDSVSFRSSAKTCEIEGAAETVALVIIEGIDRTQLIARRYANGRLTHDAEVVAERQAWGRATKEIAETLYPEPPREPKAASVPMSSTAKPPEGSSTLTWILFGSGLAAVGVGAVVGLTQESEPAPGGVLFNEELPEMGSNVPKAAAVGLLIGGFALNLAAVLTLL